MRNALCAAAFGAALALVPFHPALSQAQLSVSGGIAAPVSDLSDVADLGYNVNAGLNFGGTFHPSACGSREASTASISRTSTKTSGYSTPRRTLS